MIEKELELTEKEMFGGENGFSEDLRDVCDDLSLGWGRANIGTNAGFDENEVDMSFNSFDS